MPLAEHRLRKQKDFDNVYKQGRRLSGPAFNLTFVPNGQKLTRFAVVISKKTEKLANRRNLVRRRIRSVFQELMPRINESLDMVIVVKKPSLSHDYQKLNQELQNILRKANILK